MPPLLSPQTIVADRPASLSEPLIALTGVEKSYHMGKLEYRALRGVDLAIAPGELIAVVGPSGSGKTTILNIIAGIDRPTAGTVTVDGRRIDQMTEEQLAVWRGEHVGIVFQFFQLLPTLSALEKRSCRSTSPGVARGASAVNARSRTSRSSDWPTRLTTCRPSSRAASSSGFRSRAHLPPTRS